MPQEEYIEKIIPFIIEMVTVEKLSSTLETNFVTEQLM